MLFEKGRLGMEFTSYGKGRRRSLAIFIQMSITGQSSNLSVMTTLAMLTCLLLPHEHCNLMQSKSIWSPDQTLETCSVVESILHLEPIEVNIFKGITLPDAPRFGKVFGGQFIGQALAAASKTVDSLKIVHSLHVYFLLVGDLE
nr:acyl-CoA thioesterase 2 [Tanacetum cinerariifolium]